MLDPNDFIQTIENKILIIENKKVKHTINPYNIESIVLKSNIVIVNLSNDTNVPLMFKTKLSASVAHGRLSDTYKSFMEDNTPMVIDREIDNYYKQKLVQYFISYSDLPTNGIPNMLYITKSDKNMYIWDDSALQYILLNTRDTQPQFVYEQGVASNVWNITHNLSKFPSVTVIDSANSVLHGSINYVNNMELTINFNSPFSGKAYIQ